MSTSFRCQIVPKMQHPNLPDVACLLAVVQNMSQLGSSLPLTPSHQVLDRPTGTKSQDITSPFRIDILDKQRCTFLMVPLLEAGSYQQTSLFTLTQELPVAYRPSACRANDFLARIGAVETWLAQGASEKSASLSCNGSTPTKS